MMRIQNKAGSSYPAIARFVSHNGSNFWDLQYNNTDNSFSFDNNDNEKLRIDSGGDVTVSTGTLYIPQWISHVGDTDSKFGFLQPDIIQFDTASTLSLIHI